MRLLVLLLLAGCSIVRGGDGATCIVIGPGECAVGASVSGKVNEISPTAETALGTGVAGALMLNQTKRW